MPRIMAGILVLAFGVGACGAPTTSATSTPGPSASATARAIASSTPAATAVPSPSLAALPVIAADEPLILHARLTGVGGGIFVMRPDATGTHQLATDVLPGTHKHPDWSPDGQQVVFIDDVTEKMWIAHLNGSPTTPVPTCDVRGCDNPAWSPDGTRIAFSRYEEASGVVGPAAVGIYVVEIATGAVSTVIRLERPLLADVPRWSPDGSQILFGVDQMDDEAFETGSAIAVVPVTGGEPVYLTDFDSWAYYPDWNRVNDQIVFSTEIRSAARDYDKVTDTWDLYVIRGFRPADGGRDPVRLTSVAKGKRLWNPRWTPDGARISAGYEDTRMGVFVDPESGAIEPLPTTDLMSRPQVRAVP